MVERVEYAGGTMPVPKFATPRNLERATLGGRRADFARIWLGKPLMPHQRYVADVAGELDADGLPYYDLIVTTMQRRAGKSHLAMTKTCERCVSVPSWRAFYTAQTGGDARDAFLGFYDDVISGQPLDRLVTVLRGNGHEVMRFANGAQLRPHPPHEKAMHGKPSDENDVDEAWAFSDEAGKLLMTAIAPTQLTRPRAQTWIWSAGGTAQSTWLASLVADGRAGLVPTGPHAPRIAYFEWGIPDDLELDDLQSVAEYHPAFGYTVNLAGVRKLRTQNPDDAQFARNAGNRWTEAIGGAISADLWRSVRHDGIMADDVPVGYGAARAADGTEVVLCAAGVNASSVLMEVVETIPSAYDAADVIREVVGRDPVAVAKHGPSASLGDSLERAGVNVRWMDERESAVGVATFLDGLRAGKYLARPHVALDAAVKVAGTRRIGDGGTAWARVSAGASIAALDAASCAAYAATHREAAPTGKPAVHFAA